MDASIRLNLRQRFREVVEPTVAAEGFRLVAIELTGDSTGNIVRLYLSLIHISEPTRPY